MNSNIELWQNTLGTLQKDLDEDSFNDLFAGLTEIYKEENNYIYIVVPNSLNQYRIEKFYSNKINEIAKKLSPELKMFKFITEDEAEEDKKKKETNPLVTPTHPTDALRILSPIYTFSNFEVGESNRFAFISAMKVAETPERIYNPLYIFGDVGLGKTHLMSAIGHYILDNDINTNVVYVSSQKFAEEYFLATNSKKTDNSIENFYDKYYNADILLVDDIQFLENKHATQEEFFKVFESLTNRNKQIVLTSDRPANELKNMMDRLKSRFNWGIQVDIKAPDKKLRVSILKSKLKGLISDPNDVPMEVLELLADYFPNNIRDLEGALRGFITYCICLNIPFTKENMYIALERILPKNIDTSKPLNNGNLIKKINEVVSQYYNVSVNDMLSSSRKQQIAYARHISMYILRYKYNIPLKTIGEYFGNRDHATVAHGVEKIEYMVKDNLLAKNDIEILLKHIEKM